MSSGIVAAVSFALAFLRTILGIIATFPFGLLNLPADAANAKDEGFDGAVSLLLLSFDSFNYIQNHTKSDINRGSKDISTKFANLVHTFTIWV